MIVAANRDEFYVRPTSAAAFWPDHPEVFAGRDLEKGGTWLGVTTRGRFAALTNYRDPASRKNNPKSRGQLVSGFLTSNAAPEYYLAEVARTADDYEDFNLVIASRGRFASLSSRDRQIKFLPAGVYGLSNHLLNTPWPKVVRAKAAFSTLLAAPHLQPAAFFSLLADGMPADDPELPQTGVGLDWERKLSSIFIASPGYGTRASTVALFHRGGDILFHERSFNDHGELAGEVGQKISA